MAHEKNASDHSASRKQDGSIKKKKGGIQQHRRAKHDSAGNNMATGGGLDRFIFA
jgi:hypothetical protein